MSTRVQNKALTRKDKTLKQIPGKAWRASKCKEGRGSDTGERSTFKFQDQWENQQQWAQVGTPPIYLPAHQRSSLDPCKSHQKCWPKTDCQLLFQQNWVYLRSAENCNSGSATMASKGRRMLLQRGKEIGRVSVGSFSCLVIGWVLARKEEKSFSFLLGSALFTGHEGSPCWSPDST